MLNSLSMKRMVELIVYVCTNQMLYECPVHSKK